MDTAELTRWTALIAFVPYSVALVLRLVRRNPNPQSPIPSPHFPNRPSRALWTAGCLIFVVHVICAFQFVHHWSHDAAYAATARRTAEVTGMDWGGGIFANYAFTCLWLGDVCWWWLSAKGYESRSRWIEWSVHIFLAFMWLNATVVFGSVIARRLGAAVFLLLLGTWCLEKSK